jgi:DNA-directed RNA polymerase subunit M/transcription elongation factor TFIIS
MNESDAEHCTSCGSGRLTLQGRVADGEQVRELVCLECKHSWLVEPLPVRERAVP